MKYFYQLTKYPKIFKNTYWGNFSTENRSDEELKEIENIVNNRNKFVEDHSIVKHVIKYPKYVFNFLNELIKKHKNYIDHVEAYKTSNDKYIILISPYSNCSEWTETGFCGY